MIDGDRLRGWILGVVACAIITMVAGCSTTRYVPVEKVRTEYKDRLRTVHDTVVDTVLSHSETYQRDSMAISMKGDTVYVDRWHTKNIVKWEKATHVSNSVDKDSASAIKVDSVQVPYPVERKLTRWEQAKMDFGTAAITIAAIAIIAGIAFAVWWIRKRIRGNLKK